MLEAFLDENRDALLATIVGLSDEQARRRLVPSLTTPLGLVKHAAWVERAWFEASLAGRTRADIGIADTVDESFTPTEADTVESVVSDFRRACADSGAGAARHLLDDQVLHHQRGAFSQRWIYIHMIEELARHAGHGDILREQIEAAGPGVL